MTALSYRYQANAVLLRQPHPVLHRNLTGDLAETAATVHVYSRPRPLLGRSSNRVDFASQDLVDVLRHTQQPMRRQSHTFGVY